MCSLIGDVLKLREQAQAIGTLGPGPWGVGDVAWSTGAVHLLFYFKGKRGLGLQLFIGGEPQVRKGPDVLGNLFRAACPYERGSDSRVTQDPGDCHLGKVCPSPFLIVPSLSNKGRQTRTGPYAREDAVSSLHAKDRPA